VELKEQWSTIFEAMTKIIDIAASFNKAMACLGGYQDKWMLMLKWKSAITRETSNDLDVKQVSRAMNYVRNNFGLTFSTVDHGEFRIFRHTKTVNMQEANSSLLLASTCQFEFDTSNSNPYWLLAEALQQVRFSLSTAEGVTEPKKRNRK
jgi:hypothetical protein